jgi:hypothetical protein
VSRPCQSLKPSVHSLFLPRHRPVPQHLGQPQPLRLPPVKDRLHDIRRETGEREEPADVGVRDSLLLGEIGDRLYILSPVLVAAVPLGMLLQPAIDELGGALGESAAMMGYSGIRSGLTHATG